jgi:hypothetical protein
MAMTRRGLILFAGAAWPAFSGDSWKKKAPKDWTAEEAQEIVTKSPWAKEVSVSFDSSRMGGMPPGGGGWGGRGGGGGMGGGGGYGGGGGMGGGMPGGGMGGGGGYGGGGGMPGGGYGGGGMRGGDEGAGGVGMPPPPKAHVLWESVEPVLQAEARLERKLPSKEKLEKHHVVSVHIDPMKSPGQPQMGGRGNWGGAPQGGPGAMSPGGVSDEQRQAWRQRMLDAVTLTLKGGQPVHPVDFEFVREQEIMRSRYYFAKEGELAAIDKEMTFRSALGPMVVEAKFKPKEMVFDGKPAL